VSGGENQPFSKGVKMEGVFPDKSLFLPNNEKRKIARRKGEKI